MRVRRTNCNKNYFLWLQKLLRITRTCHNSSCSPHFFYFSFPFFGLCFFCIKEFFYHKIIGFLIKQQPQGMEISMSSIVGLEME